MIRPVVVMPLSGPGPGPGATAVGAYADTSDIFGLSKTTVPFFAFPLPVSRSRQLGAKAVGGQAPIATVVAVAAARPSSTSSFSRTPPVPSAIGAGAVRQRHEC